MERLQTSKVPLHEMRQLQSSMKTYERIINSMEAYEIIKLTGKCNYTVNSDYVNNVMRAHQSLSTLV